MSEPYIYGREAGENEKVWTAQAVERIRRTAREEALEEAAKVCDGFDWSEGRMSDAAAAIRALK